MKRAGENCAENPYDECETEEPHKIKLKRIRKPIFKFVFEKSALYDNDTHNGDYRKRRRRTVNL